MHREDGGAAGLAARNVQKLKALFSEGLPRSGELREQYRVQQAESLTRINRVVAWVGAAVVALLALFSDPSSFPEYYKAMLPGRMYAMVAGMAIGALSLVPALRSRGVRLSVFVYLAPALMMAHLTAVMDNHYSDVLAWILVNIIFCGLYPLPLQHSVVVVTLSFAYYAAVYFGLGYVADLDFRMVLANVGSATFVSLAFKVGMERIRLREFNLRVGLEKASREIADLNDRLQDENLRLSHELQVAQHIQSLVLPQESEYRAFGDLEISCQMLPADEVGGDYYDAIHFGPGGIISIGDVTDHGLHSGLIMMMVHTALRALSSVERNDIQRIYRVINKLLYDFRLKTRDHRIMSLILLKYLGDGEFVMTGQHESLLVLRKDGSVREIDSVDLGMFAGLDANVAPYLRLFGFRLDEGDTLILYTDGVTEAMDAEERMFGTRGVVEAALSRLGSSAEAMRDAIVEACRRHIGESRRFDDISVVVVKRGPEVPWDGQMRGTVHVGDRIDFDRDVQTVFSIDLLPLDLFDNWQRGSLVSNFLADYFRPGGDADGAHGLISTVVNELVENAVKFSANNSQPIELTLKKRAEGLMVRAVNTVPHHRCAPFMEVCAELFRRDLDELYLSRVEQDVQDSDASGLGLLLIRKDYSARLSFDFTFDEDSSVQVAVTADLHFAHRNG
jgi:serine phosphatase RsbU (regulator of sigma subunit)